MVKIYIGIPGIHQCDVIQSGFFGISLATALCDGMYIVFIDGIVFVTGEEKYIHVK